MAKQSKDQAAKGDLVFVTGAGGAIGRIVARTLLDRGYRVRGFGLGEQYYRDPDFFRELERRGDFQFEIGSILDQHSVVRAMSGAAKVIHLAAMTGVRRTQEDRLRCFDINVNGTQKVMAACVANGVDHVVNLSSSAVYGVPSQNPVPENEALKPQSPYALSKAAGEEVVAAFAQAFPKLHYTTLRLFNAYGEHCASTLAIDAFVTRVAQGQSPVVNGDGLQQRCYTHAEDIGEAIIRIQDAKRAQPHLQSWQPERGDQHARSCRACDRSDCSAAQSVGRICQWRTGAGKRSARNLGRYQPNRGRSRLSSADRAPRGA